MADLHQHLPCLWLQCNVGMMGLVAKALGTLLFESMKVGFWKNLWEQIEWWCSSTLFFFLGWGGVWKFCKVSGCGADWCSSPPNELLTPGETIYSKGARKLHKCTFFLNCISGESLSWHEVGMFHILLEQEGFSVIYCWACCIWQMTEKGRKGVMALGGISSGLWCWQAKRIIGLIRAVKTSDATCHASWPWNLT